MMPESKDNFPQLDNELRKIRRVTPPAPTDSPIYEYIGQVYRLGRKAAKSVELDDALKKLHATHFPRSLQNYFAVIIELTAGGRFSGSMKNKLVTTLRYARLKEVESKDVASFIKKNGGFNACADAWRRDQERTISKPRR